MTRGIQPLSGFGLKGELIRLGTITLNYKWGTIYARMSKNAYSDILKRFLVNIGSKFEPFKQREKISQAQSQRL